MQITVHLDTSIPGEADALAALVASLGGRLPDARPAYQPNVGDRPETVAAPTPPAVRPAPPAPETPRDAAEALLQQEAARVSVAAPPPPPAEPAAAGSVQLDKEGVPYDARIHSGTPTMNADGTWRKKRGIDEVEYGRIHAELQAQYAGQGNAQLQITTGTTNAPPAPNGSDIAPTPPAPPPPVSPDPTASVPAAPPPPPADVPNAPAPPTANTAPPAAESAPVAGSFGDFAAFVQAVSAIRNPQIPYKELNDTANKLGVAAFKDMKDSPDLWATFYSMSGGQ